MRFSTRVAPPEDSPAPGVIPGAVHVHNEPDHAARPKRGPGRPAQPRPSWSPFLRRFGRGHRA
jgi:hypothetical protein